MKKQIITVILLLLTILLVAACSNEETSSTPTIDNNTDTLPDTLTPAQMQHDPMSFTGQITVTGIVNYNGRFNFAVFTEGEDFELAIDYRGNQALPDVGTTIAVTGEMNYRPCCGPHILSTLFEVVEP